MCILSDVLGINLNVWNEDKTLTGNVSLTQETQRRHDWDFQDNDKEVTDGMLELDENTSTRGHEKKLKKKHCKLNICKYSFANRIIDTRNSLPNEVIAAKTVKQFKTSLDKHC